MPIIETSFQMANINSIDSIIDGNYDILTQKNILELYLNNVKFENYNSSYSFSKLCSKIINIINNKKNVEPELVISGVLVMSQILNILFII